MRLGTEGRSKAICEVCGSTYSSGQ
ncbi:hypothetical protein EC604_15930 [Paenibacillus amylolyticus]|uniref:Uncharacterized protein n=1 Tax=Paenibacillus amylolyticus TaxID=1451 RepID=A0A5M9WUL7_PAEAM|nr:hypothetical protein EC604_15930 [Paenibacillus amylolyticus]